MIMSSLAPTSLAEERVRGSLDVLMTTPLSTRSILWGKWLGTYRVVLWLAVLPAVRVRDRGLHGSSLPAIHGRRRRPEPLDLFDRITCPAWSSARCSPTARPSPAWAWPWRPGSPRLGRAIAINVVIFVLITIGWPLFFTLRHLAAASGNG